MNSIVVVSSEGVVRGVFGSPGLKLEVYIFDWDDFNSYLDGENPDFNPTSFEPIIVPSDLSEDFMVNKELYPEELY